MDITSRSDLEGKSIDELLVLLCKARERNKELEKELEKELGKKRSILLKKLILDAVNRKDVSDTSEKSDTYILK